MALFRSKQNKNQNEKPAKRHTLLWSIIIIILLLLVVAGFVITKRPDHKIVLSQDNEKILANSLLRIEFDWPVSRKMDLNIEPYIAGNWTFEDKIISQHLVKTLVFSPEVTWAADTNYTVTINGIKNVLSPWAHSKIIQFDFTTQSLPAVESILPLMNEKIKPNSNFTILLNKPNEDLAELIFSFTPEVEYNIALNESKDQYTITPKSLLKQGTSYNLNIIRKEVRYFWDTEDVAYQGEPENISTTAWQTREAPGIESFSPTGVSVKVNENISVSFSEAVTEESLNQNVVIVPAVAGAWQKQEQGKKYIYTPTTNLKHETEYTVTIKQGLQTEAGGYFEQDAVYQFTTLGRVKVLSFSPGNGGQGVGVNNSISVSFNQAVNPDSAQIRFTMEPNVEGSYSWEGNKLTFDPSDSLSFNTTYTAKVLEGVKSIDGLDLIQEFTASFATELALVKLNVPFHRQERNLSCELAALKMALNYKGVSVSETELVNKIPYDPTEHQGNIWGDPNVAFVGDINGKQPTTGYGVYWQPIADLANQYGLVGEAFTGWSIQQLTEQIKNGHPVVVWGTAGTGTRIDWQTPEGDNIIAVSGEHARTAIGYVGDYMNPTRIIVLDPLFGERYYTTSSFESNWAVLGKSGVVVK